MGEWRERESSEAPFDPLSWLESLEEVEHAQICLEEKARRIERSKSFVSRQIWLKKRRSAISEFVVLADKDAFGGVRQDVRRLQRTFVIKMNEDAEMRCKMLCIFRPARTKRRQPKTRLAGLRDVL